jgi:mannose-6-phosphate isomerase-like protein (cupin superfamily)
MTDFATLPLPIDRTAVAPDGFDVRVLLRLDGGQMAHFQLAAGEVTRAVAHRTVEEIWCIVSGAGTLWRRQEAREEQTPLEPGVCVTIPLGTHFQFRAADDSPLAAIAVTMPPWPGDDEAVFVDGPWPPSG